VSADQGGKLHFETAHRQPDQHVDLRFEMNVLWCFAPRRIRSIRRRSVMRSPTAWRSGTAGAQDVCRLSCPENDQAHQH
jgi:hypothetical protein